MFEAIFATHSRILHPDIRDPGKLPILAGLGEGIHGMLDSFMSVAGKYRILGEVANIISNTPPPSASTVIRFAATMTEDRIAVVELEIVVDPWDAWYIVQSWNIPLSSGGGVACREGGVGACRVVAVSMSYGLEVVYDDEDRFTVTRIIVGAASLVARLVLDAAASGLEEIQTPRELVSVFRVLDGTFKIVYNTRGGRG